MSEEEEDTRKKGFGTHKKALEDHLSILKYRLPYRHVSAL